MNRILKTAFITLAASLFIIWTIGALLPLKFKRDESYTRFHTAIFHEARQEVEYCQDECLWKAAHISQLWLNGRCEPFRSRHCVQLLWKYWSEVQRFRGSHMPNGVFVPILPGIRMDWIEGYNAEKSAY